MIRLEPLTGHHDRNAFDCGVTALNHWLRRTALQHQSKGISRTFVAVPLDNEVIATWCNSGYQELHPSSILGYYALAPRLSLLNLAFRFGEAIPAPDPGHTSWPFGDAV
jgi:hypothetical protein